MTDGEIYPRDMVGYGRTPPFAGWPNNARVALQFVINYEEGGENNILHGDAASEAFLSEIIGAAPWPGMRHMNMESIYEYGSRAGFWRLHRLFTDRSVPVTVYAVATAMARNREAVAAMNEAGWEIATHGLKWIDYRDIPADVEARHIAEAIRIHTEVAGARPLGFYQGRSSVNTIRLGHGRGRICLLRRHLRRRPALLARRPARAAAHGPVHARFQRHAVCDGAGLQYRRSVLRLSQGFVRHALCRGRGRAENAVDRPSLPPCRPARPRPALARFVDYASSHDRVWIPTRLDIARHWIQRHPPPGGWKPSRLTRTLFVERFGGVYEHSPWVAAAAYDAGLTAAPTPPRAWRRRSPPRRPRGRRREKRALIEAHPDLAGKLALAQDADARVRLASRRAPGSTGSRPRNWASSPPSTTPIAPASAFPSSWRSRERARPKFSLPSTAVSPTTPTPRQNRARRNRPDRGAAAQGHPGLSANARIIRGRVLSFGEDPAVGGPSAYSLIEDGAVLVAAE